MRTKKVWSRIQAETELDNRNELIFFSKICAESSPLLDCYKSISNQRCSPIFLVKKGGDWRWTDQLYQNREVKIGLLYPETAPYYCSHPVLNL